MAPPEIHGRINPWPRRLMLAWLFLTGAAIGSALTGHDHRDWQRAEQWTKVVTIEDVANGVRTIVQEQSGSNESRTAPGPNTPGVGLFGSEEDQ